MLFRNAVELWEQGHAFAAALMCRVTIERHLIEACRSQMGYEWIGDQHSLGLYRQLLVGMKLCTQHDANRIRKLWTVACQAAHGNPITYHKIGELLRCTEVLLRSWCCPDIDEGDLCCEDEEPSPEELAVV